LLGRFADVRDTYDDTAAFKVRIPIAKVLSDLSSQIRSKCVTLNGTIQTRHRLNVVKIGGLTGDEITTLSNLWAVLKT
jgi:hypothetical protein